ncbi:MAG TPA: TspO/MBR family protein [Chitinophagaceae bacterium]|nr:TspO/MBR family protein [Chitinophagaceae bacterium]
MSSYERIGFLQILNIVSFAAVVIMNGLADFLPINGQTTGEISDQYPNLFTPAAVTFSIWAVIYALLLLFCIYQGSTLFEIEKRKIDKKERAVDRIGFLFALSCLLNIAWIFAWHHHQLLLSVLIMLALLATLARIFIKIHTAGFYNGKARWFVYAPFSVYLAWISIATIANITAWLVSLGWNGFNLSASLWACIMTGAGAALGIFMLLKRNNIYFALVIVWALAGIVIKQYALSAGINAIASTALTGIALLVIIMVWKSRAKPAHQPVI